MQPGGVFGRLLTLLLKLGFPLMKNVLGPLVKILLIPLRLTAVGSAADARIQKQFLG